MLLTFITCIAFCEDVRFRFWTLFDTQLMNFIRKYFSLFILDFWYKNFKSLIAVYVYCAEGQRGIVFWSDNFKKLRGRQSVSYCYVWPGWWGNIILLGVSVRFMGPIFESFLGFREFFPRLSATFFKRVRETEVKFTSRCLRSLIGQLSLLLVPNMVLSEMNNHEHRTKQTYESYTFQPLMSFCYNLINTSVVMFWWLRSWFLIVSTRLVWNYKILKKQRNKQKTVKQWSKQTKTLSQQFLGFPNDSPLLWNNKR